MRAKPLDSKVAVARVTLSRVLLTALLASVASLAAFTPHAVAQHAAKAEPATASADPKEEARAAYARGQAAFSAGQFAAAKAAFEQAFGAVPNPIVLLSIAEAQVKLEQVPDAIDTLHHYLQLRGDAIDRAEVEAKITALSATPATLAVTSEPSGAALDVDGLPTQRTTPGQLELAPGEHTLDYSLRGYHRGSELINVKPGEKQERHLQLTALESAPGVAAAGPEATPASPGSVPAPAAATSNMPTTALWVTAGIGVASLVTGSVFGFLAVKEHSNFNDHPTQASANKGERLALFADVGFGVGVMAIATAAVLYLTADDSAAAAADDAASAKLKVTPQVAPHAIAASASFNF